MAETPVVTDFSQNVLEVAAIKQNFTAPMLRKGKFSQLPLGKENFTALELDKQIFTALENRPEKPLVLSDLPFSTYKKISIASHSVIECYKKSAFHGRYTELNGRQPTASLNIGDGSHAGALGIPLDKPLKLTPLQQKQVDGIVNALKSSETFNSLLKGAEKELSLFYTLEGLPFKSRFDIYKENPPLIADIKTCTDASPVAFRWSVAKYGYHRKEVIYRQAARLCGLPVEHFVFIAVESKPPHAVAFYTLPDEAKKEGEEQVQKLLTLYRECSRSKIYPAFSDGIQVLEWFPVKETNSTSSLWSDELVSDTQNSDPHTEEA